MRCKSRELIDLIWNEAAKRSISFSELAEILRDYPAEKLAQDWGDHAADVIEFCEMIAEAEEE